MEQRDINEYTATLLNFIISLKNKIIAIKNNNSNNNYYQSTYIERLEQIISSLNLFHILFMNCFINIDNKNNKIINEDPENLLLFEKENPNTKTILKRKALLIQWCIDEQKKIITNDSLLKFNQEQKFNGYKRILSFGQIKPGLNINKKQSLFMNLKISYLNEGNNTFEYFQKNGNINMNNNYNN